MKIVSVSIVFLVTISLAACSSEPNATNKELKVAQDNQSKLQISTPVPSLPMSQERMNLVKRAKRINVQNMESCITLFSLNGTVVAFFPVNGKVSSLNSYLLPGDRRDNGFSNAGDPIALESPDIDGAYGKNADGIFFFTADTDAYVEWQGDYFWSDQCLTPSTAPLLVRQTK